MMKHLRFVQLLALGAMALVSACSYPTRIQVENKGNTATKITVRTADGSFRHDFEDLEPGTTSAEIEAELDNHRGINVDASDNHENGTVDLEPGVLNVIQVYEDGTEPTVRVVEE